MMEIKNKSGRVRIERAIYQNIGNKKYVIVSYSKITKKTRNLAEFDNITDARIWRDSNLRNAKYGKGIQKEKNGKFTAHIMLYSKYKNKSEDLIGSYHIGTFDTPEKAKQARLEFIENLK